MEQQPSYVLKLSLTEIALRRVVVGLCNETDILASIINCKISDPERRKAWRETVQEKVKVKVSGLLLPEELKTKIMHVVKPICAEILSWKTFHGRYLSDPLEKINLLILEKLSWTSSGTIEYQKTAEKLVCWEMLDIVSRYKLACLYCLEDHIRILWKELPLNTQKYFYNEVSSTHARQPSLQFCWPYILKGEESKLFNILEVCNGNLSTFHQYAFEYSSFTGNKAAADYFFQKLTIEEREASLYSSAVAALPSFDVYPHHTRLWVYGIFERFPRGQSTYTLCYLLSLMQHEQEMLELLFKKYTYCILLCFLEWPWQDLFFDIADRIWHFLSAPDYIKLLVTLGNSPKITEYYFPKIFREAFTRCPVNFLKENVDLDCLFPLYSVVLVKEVVKVIFKNVDAAGRLKLVSSEVFFEVFYGRFRSGTGYGVEMWLREARLSQEDGKTAKKAFRAFLTRAAEGQIRDNDPRLNEFSKLLDKNAPKKRKLEVETELSMI